MFVLIFCYYFSLFFPLFKSLYVCITRKKGFFFLINHIFFGYFSFFVSCPFSLNFFHWKLAFFFVKITDYNVGNIFAQKRRMFYFFKWLHIVSKMCVFFFLVYWCICVSFIFSSFWCVCVSVWNLFFKYFLLLYVQSPFLRGFDFFFIWVYYIIWQYWQYVCIFFFFSSLVYNSFFFLLYMHNVNTKK